MPALRPIHLRSSDPFHEALARVLVLTMGIEEAYDWDAEFGPDRGPLKIEIGPGKGIWLSRMAALEPASRWVGIEIKEKRARWIAEKMVRRELANVRVIWEDAAEALSVLFRSGTADEIHINFPDPWSKRAHRKRRLIQPTFCAVLPLALKPGGFLQIVTDHAEYAGCIVKLLDQVPELENVLGPGQIAASLEGYVPSVHYEKFSAQGRSFHFIRYRRR